MTKGNSCRMIYVTILIKIVNDQNRTLNRIIKLDKIPAKMISMVNQNFSNDMLATTDQGQKLPTATVIHAISNK